MAQHEHLSERIYVGSPDDGGWPSGRAKALAFLVTGALLLGLNCASRHVDVPEIPLEYPHR